MELNDLVIFQRANQDFWHFGILMDSGVKIAISHIASLSTDSQGNVWIEAELSESEFEGYFSAPTSRTTCNINASKICAIFELADT